ncbi:hypothetical protein ACGF3J_37290 [Streptomyces sp. NPDC048171]|uniref:hypothetical protein n=1 Tax=Streptomyces sp. NPDC048171 TaxID=3365504 RepID=UPI00371A3DF1
MSEINDGYRPLEASGGVYVFDESLSPRLQINVAIKADAGEYPAEAAAAVIAGVAAVKESLEASFPSVAAQITPTVLVGAREMQ